MSSISLSTAAALLALGALTGCVTATMWGGGVEEDEDGSSSIVFTGGEPISESVFVRILATPLTLAIDLCLAPVQVFLFGWDEDEDDF